MLSADNWLAHSVHLLFGLSRVVLQFPSGSNVGGSEPQGEISAVKSGS